MTPAQIAAADQHEARERNFDRAAQRVAAFALGAVLLIAGYALLATSGYVPAAPWSPVGQQQQTTTPDGPTFDIPEGYEPAAPVPDDATVIDHNSDAAA